MKYTKRPLTFKEQANLLIDRGLEAKPFELENFLSKVNYYRFSGYLYPFRLHKQDKFISGTTFNFVKQIYDFDTDLRLLTFSAIEVIDVTILRTQQVEKFSTKYGAFCYTNVKNFDRAMDAGKHSEIIKSINENLQQSKEEFVKQYREKYGEENYFPFWMVAETSSFATLSKIFQGAPKNVIVPIAKSLNLHSDFLISWLHALSNIRNICAHHSRLWNRILPIKPQIPPIKYHAEFYQPKPMENNRFFIILNILVYLNKRIIKRETILEKFYELVERYPQVPLQMMGFPENWREYPLLRGQ